MDYYRNIWARRSDTLAPLTYIMSGKVKFKQNKTKQDSFEEIKRIVARNFLLAYPDFNEEFKIHFDARYFQLRVVIIQNRNPIAFYGVN